MKMISGRIANNKFIQRLIFVPALVFGVLIWPFVYQDVVNEWDLGRVAVTLLSGGKNGIEATSQVHMGLSYSFGYYWFIYNVLPHSFIESSQEVIRLINISGYLSSILFLLGASLLLTQLYNPAAAVIAVIVFSFSPMYLELSTSGHQILPAAALLMFGGYLLLRGELIQSLGGRIVVTATAFLLVIASLTVRAETAFALPWLCMTSILLKTDQNKVKTFAIRSTLILAAFLVFLYLQSFYIGHQDNAIVTLSNFLSRFYVPREAIKGLAVFVIAAGMITAFLIVPITIMSIKQREVRKYLVEATILIAPTLLFWLPNPTPSRHFFFAIFGAAIVIGNIAPRLTHSNRLAIMSAIAVVIANQAIAELAYPKIVSHYDWSYHQIGQRRSTSMVPMGMFYFNHEANQKMFSLFRDEGRRLAMVADPEVIVFGDEPNYIAMSLLDSDGSSIAVERDGKGSETLLVRRRNQLFRIIRKNGGWPTDVASVYISTHPIGAAGIYVQPYTISKYDKAPIRNTLLID